MWRRVRERQCQELLGCRHTSDLSEYPNTNSRPVNRTEHLPRSEESAAGRLSCPGSADSAPGERPAEGRLQADKPPGGAVCCHGGVPAARYTLYSIAVPNGIMQDSTRIYWKKNEMILFFVDLSSATGQVWMMN